MKDGKYEPVGWGGKLDVEDSREDGEETKWVDEGGKVCKQEKQSKG